VSEYTVKLGHAVNLNVIDNTKQENKMQKFEANKPVHIKTILMDKKETAEYISYNKKYKHHIVDYANAYLGVEDDEIFPLQLICDEARDVIKELVSHGQSFKLKIKTYSQRDEAICFLRENAPSFLWREDINNMLIYVRVPQSIDVGDEFILTQINLTDGAKTRTEMLKTGEVIPVEEDDIVILDPDYQRQIDEWQAKFIYVENELKEKDAENVRLVTQNNFMSEKVALYTVALAELDFSVNKIENL